MTSTSAARIVSDQKTNVCVAENCEIAFTIAVTIPTIAAQPAPLMTAQPATICRTPTIRKNQPHAWRFENSTWDERYFASEIAEIPSMMLKKPTRKRRMPARSSQLCRSTSAWTSEGGDVALGRLYQSVPDDIS